MSSKIFSLNWKDALKGLIVAVISAVLTAVYQALINNSPIDFKAIGLIALTSGLAYIIKNFLSDEQGKLGGKI